MTKEIKFVQWEGYEEAEPIVKLCKKLGMTRENYIMGPHLNRFLKANRQVSYTEKGGYYIVSFIHGTMPKTLRQVQSDYELTDEETELFDAISKAEARRRK